MTVTTFTAHDGVGSTIALLERELPALQEQQVRLETELAGVTGRLEAVRAALDSLRSLAAAPLLQEALATPAGASAAAGGAPEAATRVEEAPRTRTAAKGRARKSAPAPARKRGAKKVAAAPAEKPAKARKTSPAKSAPAAAAPRAGGLTNAIVDYLAAAGSPVRAGDVAQALGRDDSASAVNVVRTSLERLTKAGRAERVGRGLYQAVTS
jgi:hypothetical protein